MATAVSEVSRAARKSASRALAYRVARAVASTLRPALADQKVEHPIHATRRTKDATIARSRGAVVTVWSRRRIASATTKHPSALHPHPLGKKPPCDAASEPTMQNVKAPAPQSRAWTRAPAKATSRT